MVFIHVLFELIFMLIFWASVNEVLVLPNNYKPMDIYLYSSLAMVASSILELFFAVNTIPYSINSGEIDLYLIRPANVWSLFILDNMNVISFLEKLFLSSLFFLIVVIKGEYIFSLQRLALAFLLLILGTISIVLIYFIISLLSFWFGLSDNFRSVIFSLQDILRYPLGFFSKTIKMIFLTILPMGLASYYPLELLLNHIELNWHIVANYSLVLSALVVISVLMSRKGLIRYDSNN